MLIVFVSSMHVYFICIGIYVKIKPRVSCSWSEIKYTVIYENFVFIFNRPHLSSVHKNSLLKTQHIHTAVTSKQIHRSHDKLSVFVNVLKKIFSAKHSKEASHSRSRYLRQHERRGHPESGIMRPHAAGFYNPSNLTHDFAYLVSGSANLNTILAGSPRHYAFCLYTQI